MSEVFKNAYEAAREAMQTARQAIDILWPSTKAAALEAERAARWFAVLEGPAEVSAPKPEPVVDTQPVKRVRGKQVSTADRIREIHADVRRQAVEMKRLTNGLGLQGGLMA